MSSIECIVGTLGVSIACIVVDCIQPAGGVHTCAQVCTGVSKAARGRVYSPPSPSHRHIPTAYTHMYLCMHNYVRMHSCAHLCTLVHTCAHLCINIHS